MGHQNNEAADRATGKSKKKATEVLTTEQRISNIRKNLEGGLYVPATEVKLLLEEYDKLEFVESTLKSNPVDLSAPFESRASEAVAELETIPRG